MVYGEGVYGSGVYGGDDSAHPANCLCGDGWRVECTDLASGRVKAVLHPISMSWEVPDSLIGTASILVATRDPAAADIWPHDTGVYISRILPDGSRYGHFGGLIEKFSGQSGGATTLGLQSIEEYLFHRYLVTDDDGLEYTTITNPAASGVIPPTDENTKPQAQIAYELMRIVESQGRHIRSLIPLIGDPAVLRAQVQWKAMDFKNIGEAINELINKVGGLHYELVHTFLNGYWTTTIVFADSIGTTRNYDLKSDREGWQYSLEIDAKSQASRVYGIGASDSDETMFAVAYDSDAESLQANATVPEFQATPAWKDVTIPGQLDALTAGTVVNGRDPVATPVMTMVGLDWPHAPPPDQAKTGDIVGVDIGFGVITFRGEQARILSQTWQVEVDAAVQRTFALLPVIRPSLSVKLQVPSRPLTPDLDLSVGSDLDGSTQDVAPTVDPCPDPGLICNVVPDFLGEISGMQFSYANPSPYGMVWVFNDEHDETKQVWCIDLHTGKKFSTYAPSGHNRVDPEAIRRHPDGRLFLGDIGDNNATRDFVRLFATPEPAGGGDHGILGSTEYRLVYPIGSKNAETLLIHPFTGEILIITKGNPGGQGHVISFGTELQPAPAINHGTVIKSGLPAGISDGTHTLDGKNVLLRIAGEKPTWMMDANTWHKVTEIPTHAMPKSEAITVEPAGCSFLTTSEGFHQPIYRVMLPGFRQTAADNGSSSGGSGGDGVTPGTIIDLTNWKLQLPTNG